MSSQRTSISSLIRFDLGQNWDIVPEPESMTAVIGWSQWIRSYGVEPVDMVLEPVDMVVL